VRALARATCSKFLIFCQIRALRVVRFRESNVFSTISLAISLEDFRIASGQKN